MFHFCRPVVVCRIDAAMENHHQRKVALLQKLQSCTGNDMFRIASDITDGGTVVKVIYTCKHINI